MEAAPREKLLSRYNLNAERFSKYHHRRSAAKNLTNKMEAIKLRNNQVTLDEHDIKLKFSIISVKSSAKKKKDDLPMQDFHEPLKQSGELRIDENLSKKIPQELKIYEIKKAISKIKNSSAPGPDRVT